MQATIQRRSSTFTAPAPPPLQTLTGDFFSDSRSHGYQGPSRNVRLPRVTTSGGGTVAKSDDGARCVVAGRESLRVLRLLDPGDTATTEPKSAVGLGGHRIELSKNLWDGSGLKIESASTDVAWCSGNYNNKILTSARNGDLIMWDLEKSGSTKYERKTKNHVRSIHRLSCSMIVPYYCITGSADGDMRIWDIRDMSRSVMKIHHPTSVRSLVFSPTLSHPLQAAVGLDNGSIYRWDLQMGQRGQLDRLPMAHTGPILAMDWCTTSTASSKSAENAASQTERSWIISGGLDHAVKVWDLPGSSTSSHIVNKPTYVLHPSFPVRHVLWRPEYPCEVALVSNAEFNGTSSVELLASPRMQNAMPSFLTASPISEPKDVESKPGSVGETVEIWDVRRGWIAKWSVDTSISDCVVTDAVFRDSHALLVQHASGTFSQVDLRHSHRPIDAVPRVALSWNAADGSDGALAFIADKSGRWEVPYDDVHPERRSWFVDRKSRLKALGDKRRAPGLQNMGTYVRRPSSENVGPGTFVRLAKGYIVPAKSTQKKEVCALNAEVALHAGDIYAAQAWTLLESLLTDLVPELIIASLPGPGKVETHSSSPAAPHSNDGTNVHGGGSTSKPSSHRAVSADSVVQPVTSPLHSPSQPHAAHHHHHAHASRSASVNGSVVSASNEDRKHLRYRAETQPPPLPTKPPPNSRNLTPASSASSSPRHVPVSLPPVQPLPPTTTMTPTAVVQRRPSILVSTAALAHSHTRRPSVFSRITSAHSESPSVASVSDRSLRHVGEGALDDSDSSDGAASESVADSHVSEVEHAEVAPQKHHLTKARSLSTARVGPAHPSPLSRLAGQQQWTEDEECGSGASLSPCASTEMGIGTGLGLGPSKLRADDDDASPSPVSSDSDGERSDDSEGGLGHRPMMARSRSMTRSRSRKGSSLSSRRWKNRNRSSTVASLAAPLVSPPRSSSGLSVESKHQVPHALNHLTLERIGSQSSVETVIAASVREQENEVVEMGKDDGDRVVVEREPVSWGDMSFARRVAVVEEEGQLREAGWCALREALEQYADEGDIQMCAMLALVAPEELKVELGRTIQFVEAYVDMLVRHRLHACAAYIRKYSLIEEIQKATRLETVIYTACRKCRKPVVAVRSRNPFVKATHAVCVSCKEAVVKCSICHLPVRTLLFQCSICSHGGHQDCYRRYYMERPMVELPVPLTTRGRPLQRELEGENDGDEGRAKVRVKERNITGHACAAGCGHVCWVAAGQRNDSDQETLPDVM